MIEASSKTDTVMLALDGEKETQYLPLPERNEHSYLKDFLADIAGSPRKDGLTTQGVLTSARVALMAQKAADENLRDLPL